MKRMDERVRFYVKHWQRIVEWAHLRVKVSGFADEFYRSLEEDIRNEVREQEIDVEISVHEAAIRLRRHDWPAAEEGPAVELGWHMGHPLEWEFSRARVWCGIWTRTRRTRRIYFGKLSRSRERPEAAGYPERDAGRGYPMYRYIEIAPPAGNFWEDDKLEAYGNSLIRALLKAWYDLAPLVDEAVDASNP